MKSFRFSDLLKWISSLPAVFFTVIRNISIPDLARLGNFVFTMAAASLVKNKKRKCPQVILTAITGSCNLKCKQCFIRPEDKNSFIPTARLDKLLAEAEREKVKLTAFTGGEPFTNLEILDLIDKYKKLYFMIYTNAGLLDTYVISRLYKVRNVTLFIGMDGPELGTDRRRGGGMSKKIEESMEMLRHCMIPFGVSVMVTGENITCVTSESWIADLKKRGVSFLIYVPYVPAGQGIDQKLILDQQKIEYLGKRELHLQLKYGIMMLSLHWMKKKCMFNSGKAMFINHTGELGICPAAPYSNSFIGDGPVSETWNNSAFLKDIYRVHHDGSPCIIRHNQDRLSRMIEKHDALSSRNRLSFRRPG